MATINHIPVFNRYGKAVAMLDADTYRAVYNYMDDEERPFDLAERNPFMEFPYDPATEVELTAQTFQRVSFRWKVTKLYQNGSRRPVWTQRFLVITSPLPQKFYGLVPIPGAFDECPTPSKTTAWTVSNFFQRAKSLLGLSRQK